VSLAYVNDAIILGSCIPQMLGLPKAKEAIQQARENDLRGREKRDASGKKIGCYEGGGDGSGIWALC
jgi:hypothetical protein